MLRRSLFNHKKKNEVLDISLVCPITVKHEMHTRYLDKQHWMREKLSAI